MPVGGIGAVGARVGLRTYRAPAAATPTSGGGPIGLLLILTKAA